MWDSFTVLDHVSSVLFRYLSHFLAAGSSPNCSPAACLFLVGEDQEDGGLVETATGSPVVIELYGRPLASQQIS